MGAMVLNELTETLAEHVYTAGEIVTFRKIRGLLLKISWTRAPNTRLCVGFGWGRTPELG